MNWKLLLDWKKTTKLARDCRGKHCLSWFDTHVWRYYKLEVEPKLQDNK